METTVSKVQKSDVTPCLIDDRTSEDSQSAWLAVNRNLYGAIGNDPVNSVDFFGLQGSCQPANLLILADIEAAAYEAAAATAVAAATVVVVSETRQYGKGERKWQHKSDNPWKGWRVDPKDPTKIRGKDQNGKDVVKPRPKDFPDPEPKPQPPKENPPKPDAPKPQPGCEGGAK